MRGKPDPFRNRPGSDLVEIPVAFGFHVGENTHMETLVQFIIYTLAALVALRGITAKSTNYRII